MNYVKNLDRIYYSIKDNDNACYSLTGVKPQGTLVPISDKPYIVENFTGKTKEEFNQELKVIVSKNGFLLDHEDFYLGAWMNADGDLHLDVCANYPDTQKAIQNAIIRGVSKLIITKGMKHPVSINIPSPQTVGSNTQKNSYAVVKSRQIVNELNEKYGF